jgi:hemerythrin-like domain-containing protein
MSSGFLTEEVKSMNAIELLLDDHREAIELVEFLEHADVDQLETASEATNPVQLHMTTFNKLKNALAVHTQIEEQIFYPALEGFDETRAIVESYYDEHEDVDKILADLSKFKPTDEWWIGKIRDLRENLYQHIDKEEKELFPLAERLLGEEKLQELSRQIEEMKNSRPAAKATSR